MPTRQEVRTAFQSVASGVFSGTIYPSRRVDSRSLTEFMQVYLSEGQTEPTMGRSYSLESDIIVSYYKQNADDAALDTVADQVKSALLDDFINPTNSTLKTVVGAIAYSGYEYGDHEDGTPGISLRFTIKYGE